MFKRLYEESFSHAYHLIVRKGQRMITIRPAGERGHTDFGWLDSRHSFSFGEYQDYDHMGFHSLRVINDDRVARGGGFPTHPHRDMEIITWVLSGALEHKDSLGTGSVIRAGDVQRMTAGSGILHSEFNASKTEPVHFMQIWIFPEKRGLKPGYAQTSFPPTDRRGQLKLIASRDGRDGSLSIHQDASVYATALGPGHKVTHTLVPRRAAWVQVATGSIKLNGKTLNSGDGAAVEDETTLELVGVYAGEALLFDLA
jgi:redox-sensitive bicupin YhaK (pirin superfamily)